MFVFFRINVSVVDSCFEKSKEAETGWPAVNCPQLSKGIGIFTTVFFYGFVTHVDVYTSVIIFRVRASSTLRKKQGPYNFEVKVLLLSFAQNLYFSPRSRI